MRWFDRMDGIILRARNGASFGRPVTAGIFDGEAFCWMWEDAVRDISFFVRAEIGVRIFPDIPEAGVMRIEIFGDVWNEDRLVVEFGYCHSFETKMSVIYEKEFSVYKQLMIPIGNALVGARKNARNAVDVLNASRL